MVQGTMVQSTQKVFFVVENAACLGTKSRSFHATSDTSLLFIF